MRFNSIDAAVSACLAADSRAWDLLCLRSDPMFRLFSAQQIEEILHISAACGTDEAAQHLVCGCADPFMLAGTFGVIIQRSGPERFHNPRAVNFAQVKGNEVRLSGRVIEKIERALERLDCREALGAFSVPALMAAHELYHCIEDRDSGLATRTMKVPVTQFRFLRRRITPLAAGEIGAYAFTKKLLSLPFHPKLAEVLGMWETKPEAAARMAETLYMLGETGA